MIEAKRLIELASKWQRMASAYHRRISYPRSVADLDPSVANKGYIFVNTADKKKFMIPLEYLSQNVFRELLRMSEEEFGLPSFGAITLPCDSILLEYVISSVQLRMPEELEKTLLASIATCNHLASSSLVQGQSHQQTLIFGY